MQPPASIKALGDPIYEAFYGLKEQPFAITTDPRFFYLAASHQRAFSELLNGLRRREGVMLLTGDTGTGKTTLCRAVIEALGERTFAAMVLNPYMTGAEVLRIVLRDFGLVAHEDLRRGALASADVPQLLDTLEGFLQSLAPIGSHAVIILDEAQSVPAQTLDQLRLLTALEQGGQRLVQLVLCGQAGLLSTIKAEPLAALNERITRRVELTPLPVDQVEAYIQHRLGVAGGADSVSFDALAARTVAELSRGLPRRINVLCDRALQEGRIEGVSVITAPLVKRAARAVAGAHEPITAGPVAPTAPVRVAAATPVPPPVPAPAQELKVAPLTAAHPPAVTPVKPAWHAASAPVVRAPSAAPVKSAWDELVPPMPPPPVPAPAPIGLAAPVALRSPIEPTIVESGADLAPVTLAEAAPLTPAPSPFSAVLIPDVEVETAPPAAPTPPPPEAPEIAAETADLVAAATSVPHLVAPDEVAHDRASVAEGEPALPTVMFGHAVAEEEQPAPQSRRWLKVAVGIAVFAALAAAGLFAYMRSMPGPETTLGAPPSAPPPEIGVPADALPVPEPEVAAQPAEMPPGPNGLSPTTGPSPAATPSSPTAPGVSPPTPDAATPEPSPQVPENRDQVN